LFFREEGTEAKCFSVFLALKRQKPTGCRHRDWRLAVRLRRAVKKQLYYMYCAYDMYYTSSERRPIMAKKETSTETTSPRSIRLTDGTFDALNARRYETTLDDLGAGNAREGDDAVALDAFSEPTQRARPPPK